MSDSPESEPPDNKPPEPPPAPPSQPDPELITYIEKRDATSETTEHSDDGS